MGKGINTSVIAIGALLLFVLGCGTKDPVSYAGTARGDTAAIQAILAANGLPTTNLNVYSSWRSGRVVNLRVSRQSISALPRLGELTALEYLFIDHNNLSVLPNEIGNLTELTYVDASYNVLTSLPVEIGNLNKMTTLNVSFNNITSLPATIGDCDTLLVLNLQNNELTTLPLTVMNLAYLDILNIDSNHLGALLPAAIKSFITDTLNRGFDSAWIATQTP